MHMYDWMDGAISINLWTTDTCAVISWSGGLIGSDCNDQWFDLCKLKERMRKYFNIKNIKDCLEKKTDKCFSLPNKWSKTLICGQKSKVKSLHMH